MGVLKKTKIHICPNNPEFRLKDQMVNGNKVK